MRVAPMLRRQGLRVVTGPACSAPTPSACSSSLAPPALPSRSLGSGRRALAASSGGGSSGGGSGGSQDNEEEEVKAEDLYKVLGLPRGADPDQIKAAYRRLAKENHPDMRPGNAAAQARFREVSHAHQTLLHVGLRRMYDLHLRHQDARVRAEAIRTEEETSGVRGFLLLRRGRGAAAAVGAVWVAAASLLIYGLWEWLTRSPGLFWACFRALPDWAPGKWRLAEFYLASSTAAQRRCREGGGGGEASSSVAASAAGGGAPS